METTGYPASWLSPRWRCPVSRRAGIDRLHRSSAADSTKTKSQNLQRGSSDVESEAAVGECLSLFDPGDVVALKRLDAFCCSIDHALEDDQPAAWGLDAVVEDSELRSFADWASVF
jgi:hypothetical protein